MIRARTIKRVKIKTPGGKTVMHFKKKKHGYSVCSRCGAKLNRPKLNPTQMKKLPKTKKRPERPFPELCSKCMRGYFKEKVRG